MENIHHFGYSPPLPCITISTYLEWQDWDKDQDTGAWCTHLDLATLIFTATPERCLPSSNIIITSNHFQVSLKEHITKYIKNIHENAEVPFMKQEKKRQKSFNQEDLAECAFVSKI